MRHSYYRYLMYLAIYLPNNDVHILYIYSLDTKQFYTKNSKRYSFRELKNNVRKSVLKKKQIEPGLISNPCAVPLLVNFVIIKIFGMERKVQLQVPFEFLRKKFISLQDLQKTFASHLVALMRFLFDVEKSRRYLFIDPLLLVSTFSGHNLKLKFCWNN